MTRVFIGGSRHITRLNAQIRQRLDRVVEKAYPVVLGDANGVDKAVQSYLSELGYTNVTIYCTEGGLRNNLGNWPVNVIPRGVLRKSFEFYALKDRAMAMEATSGLMLWDGESRGTLTNITNLLTASKIVLVYVSPLKHWSTFSSLRELANYATSAPSGVGMTIGRHLLALSEDPSTQIDMHAGMQRRASGH